MSDENLIRCIGWTIVVALVALLVVPALVIG